VEGVDRLEEEELLVFLVLGRRVLLDRLPPPRRRLPADLGVGALEMGGRVSERRASSSGNKQGD